VAASLVRLRATWPSTGRAFTALVHHIPPMTVNRTGASASSSAGVSTGSRVRAVRSARWPREIQSAVSVSLAARVARVVQPSNASNPVKSRPRRAGRTDARRARRGRCPRGGTTRPCRRPACARCAVGCMDAATLSSAKWGEFVRRLLDVLDPVPPPRAAPDPPPRPERAVPPRHRWRAWPSSRVRVAFRRTAPRRQRRLPGSRSAPCRCREPRRRPPRGDGGQGRRRQCPAVHQ
jgi:hypothetical protein